MAYRVLVFGHSFVERLRRQTRRDVTKLDLNREEFDVCLQGFGGLTLPKAQGYFRRIEQDASHIVILDIGSNDLHNVAVSSYVDIKEVAVELA